MKKFATAAIAFSAISMTILTPAPSSAVPLKLYYNPAERAAIRQMPITERPFRPIHVYGNTVRLLNRVGVPVAQ